MTDRDDDDTLSDISFAEMYAALPEPPLWDRVNAMFPLPIAEEDHKRRPYAAEFVVAARKTAMLCMEYIPQGSCFPAIMKMLVGRLVLTHLEVAWKIALNRPGHVYVFDPTQYWKGITHHQTVAAFGKTYRYLKGARGIGVLSQTLAGLREVDDFRKIVPEPLRPFLTEIGGGLVLADHTVPA